MPLAVFKPGNSSTIKSDCVGNAYFPQGDSIEITSVARTKDRMAVKGHYNLVSADSAQLALYITSTNKDNASGPEDPRQTMQISKGRVISLIRSHLFPGLPHLAMYASEKFRDLYFGTQAEASEESKMNRQPTCLCAR